MMDPINAIPSDNQRLTMSNQLSEQQENKVVEQALSILHNRLQKKGNFMVTKVTSAKRYMKLKLLEKQQEVFVCLFLDNQHRLIETRELFHGSIDGCSVYPREVVKQALSLNAAALVFSHNHPSGKTDPSEADKRITQRLKEALSLVDIRVLDHLIIGDEDVLSFAEQGIL